MYSIVVVFWQSQTAEGEAGEEGRFPVHLVDRVNHAQIGSGDVPSFVQAGQPPPSSTDALTIM